jgi:glycosyltransferase involved in cell wall biosynthesis
MKGHKVFIAAAARIVTRHPDVKFVAVGDGSDQQRRALRDLAQELGLTERVIWAGQRLDMPAVISALDLSVSASFGEGFSNVLGESMSCGVPCVATNVGDSAKIVGDLGWLVDPGDEVGLADQIIEAMRFCRTPEFRPELIRRRIEREFSVQRLVDDTTAALCSLGND